jgi:hypothetical protein
MASTPLSVPKGLPATHADRTAACLVEDHRLLALRRQVQRGCSASALFRGRSSTHRPHCTQFFSINAAAGFAGCRSAAAWAGVDAGSGTGCTSLSSVSAPRGEPAAAVESCSGNDLRGACSSQVVQRQLQRRALCLPARQSWPPPPRRARLGGAVAVRCPGRAHRVGHAADAGVGRT